MDVAADVRDIIAKQETADWDEVEPAIDDDKEPEADDALVDDEVAEVRAAAN